MEKTAKPFIKWAGGKTQLLHEIDSAIPEKLKYSNFTYIEPFVGGGAVLFWILQKYPNIKKAIINDINTDLINSYRTIKENVEKVIIVLRNWEKEYHLLSDKPEEKKEYYYLKRKLFNSRKSDLITQTALFIFLNRTCFNGLYRVNKKNEFNVPIGSYKKPMICDEENLRAVSQVLKKVTILNGDFENTLKYAENNTLFYFDPPYYPLNKTSNFTSYDSNRFLEKEQIRLFKLFNELDKKDCFVLLSNSDTNFIKDLYKDYNINIVNANRFINSQSNGRGKINEILVRNY